ncbi:putative mitochondrial intermediate peptidase, mitochondrial [Sesbania bispinosa]|nr:putative mitochondrial intermediate peptidase, mitochondrial [Sesbania bispinosa]
MWSVASRAVQVFRRKKPNPLTLRLRAFSSLKPTGLYGFPILKTPKGYQAFVDEAIQRSRELVSYIATKPSAMEIMRTMDEISDTVCSVIDSAELCRQTHPNREFVEEANKASMRMSEYLHVR